MKSMKHLKTALCIAVAFTGTHALANGEKPSVRGSGHVVDVNGTPELLDLVVKSACVWKDGSDVLASLPALQSALDKIAAIDWYFARELKTEIEFLDYCYTGKLAKLDARDDDTIVVDPMPRTQQVALRSNSEVYIDQEIFGRMKDRSQAFTIIHEAMHSYLSMETPQRKMKLRSIVNALSEVEKGTITTRKSLHLQMSQNNILFPLTVQNLTRFRPQVEYVTGTPEARRALILAQKEPETLAKPDISNFKKWLAYWDCHGPSSQAILQDDIRSILLDGSIEEFNFVMNVMKFTDIEPEVIALALLADLSSDKRVMLYQSPRFLGVTERTYEWISTSQVSRGTYRILADRNFQKLAASKPTETVQPLTGLVPRKLGTAEAPLPEKLQALAELTANLVKQKAWDELAALVTNSNSFYEAMGLKEQYYAIHQMKPFVPHEKALALSVIEQIRDGVIEAWLNAVKMSVQNDDLYSEFYAKVKFSNFEYNATTGGAQ